MALSVPFTAQTTAAPMPLPENTLLLGDRRFGTVKALQGGVTAAEAAALTTKNGYDEIFFTDELGKTYVAYGTGDAFNGMRAGYLGRYNGQKVKVVSVENEDNSVAEGVKSTWRWAGNILSNTFGAEASKTVSNVASTAIGSFFAAAALKETIQNAPKLAGPGFMAMVKGIGSGFIRSIGSVAIAATGVLAAVSLVNGVRAGSKGKDMTGLNMITGNY